MNLLTSLLKRWYPYILICCYALFVPLSWVLILRDGRISYSILLFYPELKPWYHSIEPHLVAYGINSIPTILFIGIIIAAGICYIFSLRLKLALKKVVLYALIFQSIIFLSYPILSSDIFSYIFSDRMLTVHHENVWKVTPDTHKDDAFIMFAAWEKNTRVYGGVNQAVYTPFSYLGGNNLLVVVILYKVVAWIFVLLSMWIVYLIAKKYFKGKEAFALHLIFWNPLFLIEFLSSGHNDILMLFFMLCGLYFFLGKKVWLAALCLALAAQVKIIALVLCIFFLFFYLQKKQMKNIVLFGVTFLVVNAVIFYFMDVDPLTFAKAILFNTGVYWQGFPAVIHTYFPGEKIFVSVGMIFSLAWWIYLQGKNKIHALEAYCGFILFYLLFFASAYWNWYALWAFCFVPFLHSYRMRLVLVMLTFSSLLLYPLYWISLRFSSLPIDWVLLTYLFFSGTVLCSYLLPQKYADYLLTHT